jgi:8-oxo-dGTP pyrophosphatase MutT (NUDIX family)
VIVRDGKILLVAFDDEHGFHYNLPGGGIEPGESAHEAMRREAWEEARAEVSVGRLLLAIDYPPSADLMHRVGFIFECALKPGSEPAMPDTPDPNQIGIVWVALDDLSDAPLLPRIAGLLTDMLAGRAAQEDRYLLYRLAAS